MQKCIVAAVIGLSFLAVSLKGVAADRQTPDAGAAPAGGGLSLVRIDLLDGRQWILGTAMGRHDIGRPFAVRLVLVNRGAVPVTIWDPTNSEGSTAPGVILTDEDGKETVLKARPIERSGVPSVWVIEPNAARTITIDLLRLVPPAGIRPGPYSIRGVFENSHVNNEVFVKGRVWTGRIESPTCAMQVIGF